jgi:hypothetical protein
MRNGEVACYYMGNVHTREWALLDEGRPEEGLKLTYRAGTSCDGRTGRSMEHHFICDPSVRPAPPPPSRTNWTRLVPPPVLTGHVSSLLP